MWKRNSTQNFGGELRVNLCWHEATLQRHRFFYSVCLHAGAPSLFSDSALNRNKPCLSLQHPGSVRRLIPRTLALMLNTQPLTLSLPRGLGKWKKGRFVLVVLALWEKYIIQDMIADFMRRCENRCLRSILRIRWFKNDFTPSWRPLFLYTKLLCAFKS